MQLSDILKFDQGSKEQAASFFNQLWTELEVPIFRDTENVIEGDLKNGRRRVKPQMMSAPIMKGMTSREEKFILVRTKHVSFYEQNLSRARDKNCSTDDDDETSCCDDSMTNVDVLLRHEDPEVIGFTIDKGLLAVYGDSYHFAPILETAGSEAVMPSRILALLAGDPLSIIDDDGENHMTRIDI